ncbi:hypothetical protein [Vibrio crassostreae]|uniref:hypothetical protein n=1 Tax=Vibrio crassostreae TaxID=246167 RepID=UPI001B310917|nr:hypothetical protein [Vibrio crassostreae]
MPRRKSYKKQDIIDAANKLNERCLKVSGYLLREEIGSGSPNGLMGDYMAILKAYPEEFNKPIDSVKQKTTHEQYSDLNDKISKLDIKIDTILKILRG